MSGAPWCTLRLFGALWCTLNKNKRLKQVCRARRRPRNPHKAIGRNAVSQEGTKQAFWPGKTNGGMVMVSDEIVNLLIVFDCGLIDRETFEKKLKEFQDRITGRKEKKSWND